MSLKYSNLVAPAFATAFLAAKGMSADGFNAAVSLAKDQFTVTEQVKEYAADVEKSGMYIGMDVERQLAVDVGYIKIGIAKDRAGYKSELAAAVKNVKTQQALLEGQFGVDVASVKKDIDIKTLGLVSTLDEETATTVSSNEYTSTVGLTNLEIESSNRVNTAEDTFRRGLSDSDYSAAVSIANTRANNITARGEVDKLAIVKESTVTDQGLRWAYDTEAGGIRNTAVTEQGLIQEQGYADRQNIIDMSGIKISSTQEMSAAEVIGINDVSDNKVSLLASQADMQVALGHEYAAASRALAIEMGVLEAGYIGTEAAARDQAYLIGARADLKVDAKRYEAEADSIRSLAINKTTYITKQAQAEADSKVRIAGIEGAAEVTRAIKEGQNDVQMALLRGSQQVRIAGLKASASDEIAIKQANNIIDMSAIVVGQISSDALAESGHVSAMSIIDVDRYTQIQSREVESSVVNAAMSIKHVQNTTGLTNEHLAVMGAAQAGYILDASKVGIKAAVDRMTEEARYIAEETVNRVERINSLTASSIGLITQQAASSAAKIRALADESYDNAASIIDAEYETNVQTAYEISYISTSVAEWSADTDATVSGFISGVQAATAELGKYAKSYTNYYDGDVAGGEIIVSGGPIDIPRLNNSMPSYNPPAPV